MPGRDLSFEALVEVTGATVDLERGPLNKALKTIRDEEPDLDDEDLALLIRLRAKDYRKVFPEMATPTPMALAKHWNRVYTEIAQRSEEKPKSTADERITVCPTCGGDRVVTVSYRPSKNPKIPHSVFEECAPCPDCNPRVISWWHNDGSQSRTPDPETVREMLQ